MSSTLASAIRQPPRRALSDAVHSHALATAGNRNVCVVLSPSHEIKLFAEGVQVFSFRNALAPARPQAIR